MNQLVTQPYLPSPWIVPLVPEGASIASSSTPSVAVWPSANRAIYVPFSLPVNQRMKSVSCWCTTTNSANFDLGLYDVSGNRLGSLGSTALAAGINTWTPTTPIQLLAGTLYYVAMVAASTSSTIARHNHAVPAYRAAGHAIQASALPLPSTFTLAQSATGYMPILALNFVETPS